MKKLSTQDYITNKLVENEKRMNNLEIELKSFLKNITITKWFVVGILALLGFFGFREIVQIRKSVMDSIKPHIEYVDSMVASIETSKIDSLSGLIRKREQEQKNLMQKLTNLISSTAEIEKKHIQLMSPNQACNINTKYPHTAKSFHNFFEVIQPKNKTFKTGSYKRNIVLKLLIPADSVHHLLAEVFEKEWKLKGSYTYIAKDGYNKLEFTVNLQSSNFIEVGFFLKSDWDSDAPCFYKARIDIK